MPKITPITPEKLRAADYRLKMANAKYREVQTKKELAELLPKDELQKQLSLILVSARNKLLSLPSKLSPQLATIDDPLEIAAILEQEIHFILTELSNGN